MISLMNSTPELKNGLTMREVHVWIFAYEIFDEGVIVRDMAHTATLAE
jgi:hypothetical protein